MHDKGGGGKRVAPPARTDCEEVLTTELAELDDNSILLALKQETSKQWQRQQ
jgi:hypothetical protein